MPEHRIFTTPFAKVYPMYVLKAERKNRTKEEVDQVICWLTGYDQAGLQRQIDQQADFRLDKLVDELAKGKKLEQILRR